MIVPVDAAIFGFHAVLWGVFIARAAGLFGVPHDRSHSVAPTAERTAQGSRVVLVIHAVALVVLYVGIVAAVLWGPPRPPLARAIGATLILGAAALSAWTLAVFRSWRLRARIDPGHELVTAGPFRWVRHPIYLALDIFALGSTIWLPTPLAAAGLVLIAVGGDLRARAEERVLVESFGDRYRDYARRTRRFVPGVY